MLSTWISSPRLNGTPTGTLYPFALPFTCTPLLESVNHHRSEVPWIDVGVQGWLRDLARIVSSAVLR